MDSGRKKTAEMQGQDHLYCTVHISVYQYWNSYEEGVDFYQLYGGRYLITRGLYPVIGATPACLCLRLKIPPQRLKISSQSLKITPQKY